jgi:hypothetical protein
VLGLPTVLFFNHGILDEYDFWVGTVAIFFFALVESVLFAWVFGIDKGWDELHQGADIRIPSIYKFIIKYITPTFLLIIFMSSLFKPEGGDVAAALSNISNGWTLDNSSIVKQLFNASLKQELAAATDEVTKSSIETKLMLVNSFRALLLVAFAGISYMVFVAYKKRKGIIM